MKFWKVEVYLIWSGILGAECAYFDATKFADVMRISHIYGPFALLGEVLVLIGARFLDS